MQQHYLWVEKYRPTSFNDYLFHDSSHKRSFERMVHEKEIPHLLLSGTAGSGKTSLAFALFKELDVNPSDLMTINASDENSVDVIREKIKTSVTSIPFGDLGFKIVHLEEADYISPAGQAILRRLMEEFSDGARFVLTCNYDNKIIPAVRSRCQHFRFNKHNIEDVLELTATILAKERVRSSMSTLESYVRVGFPDIRKIINLLQQNTHEGVLQSLRDASAESSDYKLTILDLLEQDDWETIREVCCAEVQPEEWEDLYRFLYTNIEKCPKFEQPARWDKAIVIIAEYLYRHSFVADGEINFAACAIKLSNI